MKQVLENFKTGECIVEDVPQPVVRDNFVLVRNHFSLISTGTEGGTVKLGKMSLLGKAKARPEQVMKVLQVAKTQGLLVAYNAAMRSLEMPVVLGYCTAGEVIAVGAGVGDLKVGDRVACGGAGFANHAEVVCVPKNLCVAVPDAVDLRYAAFTTIGAIALQSLRIADVRLGEKVVVIGLGLVGLITVQLLRATGCRVFGIDIDRERVDLVINNGYGDAAVNNAKNLSERVKAFSSGWGADAAIITAAAENNEPVALAGELVRRKGRVVVVGRTKIEAPRETYLFKELELCTSMAYGPGTGDPAYELDGMDYPYGYVRWTEGRNMAGVLDLVAAGSLKFEELITHEFPVDDAGQAFELITGKTKERSTAVLLHYPKRTSESPDAPYQAQRLIAARAAVNKDEIGISVIGAGSFATNEFLPLLCRQSNISLRMISSATGVRATALGKKYGFESCCSSPEPVIEDEHTDCIFILTRHDSHAELAAAALNAGKHVFVEKPLALDYEELDKVVNALSESGLNLMVGFNRRYAQLAIRMKNYFGSRAQPASVNYCANAGFRPPEHWLHDPKQGGGVILGEACHHIDFCNWLIDRPVTGVETRMLGANKDGFISADNIHITISYADGSLAHISYLSNGSKAHIAERCEVFCDNKVAILSDFKSLELAHGIRKKQHKLWFRSDKGHRREIEQFLNAVRGIDGVFLDVDGYIESSRTAIEAAVVLSGVEIAPAKKSNS